MTGWVSIRLISFASIESPLVLLKLWHIAPDGEKGCCMYMTWICNQLWVQTVNSMFQFSIWKYKADGLIFHCLLFIKLSTPLLFLFYKLDDASNMMSPPLRCGQPAHRKWTTAYKPAAQQDHLRSSSWHVWNATYKLNAGHDLPFKCASYVCIKWTFCAN